MKPVKRTIIVLMICVFGLTISSSRLLYAQTEKSKTDDTITAFQNSREWKKLTPPMKSAWLDAMKSGNTDLKLECFVTVRYPPDQGDESFLISNGFIVQMFAGAIARGHMKASAMPDVAKLYFVKSINLATSKSKK